MEITSIISSQGSGVNFRIQQDMKEFLKTGFLMGMD